MVLQSDNSMSSSNITPSSHSTSKNSIPLPMSYMVCYRLDQKTKNSIRRIQSLDDNYKARKNDYRSTLNNYTLRWLTAHNPTDSDGYSVDILGGQQLWEWIRDELDGSIRNYPVSDWEGVRRRAMKGDYEVVRGLVDSILSDTARDVA